MLISPDRGGALGSCGEVDSSYPSVHFLLLLPISISSSIACTRSVASSFLLGLTKASCAFFSFSLSEVHLPSVFGRRAEIPCSLCLLSYMLFFACASPSRLLSSSSSCASLSLGLVYCINRRSRVYLAQQLGKKEEEEGEERPEEERKREAEAEEEAVEEKKKQEEEGEQEKQQHCRRKSRHEKKEDKKKTNSLSCDWLQVSSEEEDFAAFSPVWRDSFSRDTKTRRRGRGGEQAKEEEEENTARVAYLSLRKNTVGLGLSRSQVFSPSTNSFLPSVEEEISICARGTPRQEASSDGKEREGLLKTSYSRERSPAEEEEKYSCQGSESFSCTDVV